MGQGEFGPPVSMSLPLPGFAVCVLLYRQVGPTPGKSRVWEQKSALREMSLSDWPALVAGISTAAMLLWKCGVPHYGSYEGLLHGLLPFLIPSIPLFTKCFFKKSISIYDKNSPESGHRGNLTQHNKSHI